MEIRSIKVYILEKYLMTQLLNTRNQIHNLEKKKIVRKKELNYFPPINSTK